MKQADFYGGGDPSRGGPSTDQGRKNWGIYFNKIQCNNYFLKALTKSDRSGRRL